ncbi:hypothetical protein B0H19DRAFT_1085078 [Mycena capillaripes]|nr:hypothetical protein B0H19DRAFT_1085078 [Mycena capillaripes]
MSTKKTSGRVTSLFQTRPFINSIYENGDLISYLPDLDAGGSGPKREIPSDVGDIPNWVGRSRSSQNGRAILFIAAAMTWVMVVYLLYVASQYTNISGCTQPIYGYAWVHPANMQICVGAPSQKGNIAGCTQPRMEEAGSTQPKMRHVVGAPGVITGCSQCHDRVLPDVDGKVLPGMLGAPGCGDQDAPRHWWVLPLSIWMLPDVNVGAPSMLNVVETADKLGAEQ